MPKAIFEFSGFKKETTISESLLNQSMVGFIPIRIPLSIGIVVGWASETTPNHLQMMDIPFEYNYYNETTDTHYYRLASHFERRRKTG